MFLWFLKYGTRKVRVNHYSYPPNTRKRWKWNEAVLLWITSERKQISMAKNNETETNEKASLFWRKRLQVDGAHPVFLNLWSIMLKPGCVERVLGQHTEIKH